MLDAQTNEEKFIELANQSRTSHEWNLKHYPTVFASFDEAAKYFSTYHQKTPTESSGDAFATFRKVVRQKRLEECIADSSATSTVGLTFDGYGDSGNHYFNETYPDYLATFLNFAMDELVTFDWYNNDGGGGDLTWDLSTDKIIVNGYTNYTETHQEMDEEEF